MGYLALLLFFLGLFFFLLFSLIVGALMFRFGREAMPAPRRALWAIGTFVAVLIVTTGLASEYYGFIGLRAFGREVDGDAFLKVRESFLVSFTPEEMTALRAGTRDHILSFLEREYPPGGFVGYLRWALVDGQMDCPRSFDERTAPVSLRHRRTKWLIRVTLSLVLVTFGIMSQVLGLAQVPKPDASPSERGDASVVGSEGPS